MDFSFISLGYALFSRRQARRHFVSGPDDTRHVRKTDQLILGGDCVFVALQSTGITPANPDAYIEQTPLPVQGLGFSIFGKRETESLRLWISRDMLDAIRPFRNSLLSCAHYLRYGLSQRADMVVVGGAEDLSGINLEVYAFKSGRLIGVDERKLCPRAHRDLAVELDVALDSIRQQYRGFRIVIAAPLESFGGGAQVEYIGDAPFRRTVTEPIYFGEEISILHRYRLSLGIAGGVLLIYTVTLASVWKIYLSARNEFRAESQGMAQFDEARLAMLKNQQIFLTGSLPQIGMMKRAGKIAGALASIDHLVVRRIFVAGQDNSAVFGGLSKDANFAFEAEILAVPNIDEREQLLPVLERLSRTVGGEFRLLRHDAKSDTASGSNQIRFIVEGIANDA